jgi:hypothetical protein
VRAVAQRLGLEADLARVLGRVDRSFAGAPLEQSLGRPVVDGVGGRLDLEDPVRDVLLNATLGQARATGGALQRTELRPALTGGGEKPRLDGAAVAHALDAPAALRKPHVAQASAEQPALAALLGDDTECAEPTLHHRRIHALAVVRAAHLLAPHREARHTRNRRSSRRQSAGKLGSGAPNVSWMRPWPRPAAAIAASALVTSSGTTCTRSKPPWAKFSRK